MGACGIVRNRLFAGFVCAVMLVLRCVGASSGSANASAEFDRANRLYEQGKFTEAAAVYEDLALHGGGTPSVWFNFGNAAYKSGQLGRAIAAYRMAERLTPRDASLRANLQFVRGKVYSDERTHVPWWKNAVRLATVDEWTGLTVALLWAFFSVLACAEWAGRRYTRTAGVLLVLALLGGTGLCVAWEDRTAPAVIVMAKEATLRQSPFDESQSKFQLRDGAELVVLSMKGDWFEVRDPEKRIGWIRRDEVLVLPGRAT
jgi:tetratricopeptide (TPR) repeat protein